MRGRHKPPDDVRGTPEFKAFLLELNIESDLYKIIKKGMGDLGNDMLVGEKVEKKKWPQIYVRKYGITSLFKLNLDRDYRLTYTIIAEGMKKIICIIEVMNHKEYNRRFGYR